MPLQSNLKRQGAGRTAAQRQFDVVHAIKKELQAKQRLIVEQVKVGLDKQEVTNAAFLSLQNKLSKLPPMDESMYIEILSLISGSGAWGAEHGKELAGGVPISDSPMIAETRCMQVCDFFEAYMRASDWDIINGEGHFEYAIQAGWEPVETYCSYNAPANQTKTKNKTNKHMPMHLCVGNADAPWNLAAHAEAVMLRQC